MMLRVLLLLLLVFLVAAGPARAERIFTLDPEFALPDQPVQLHAVETDGCYEFDEHTVTVEGNVVTVEILVSDFVVLPCPAGQVSPVSFALGAFAAGVYTVDVQECGALPLFPCTTHTTLTLTVAAANSRRFTVPAAGGIALMLLGVGATLVALVAFTGRAAGPPR